MMTAAERENFVRMGFSQEQIEEIEEGRKAGIDTSIYEKKEFMAIQMCQIRWGLMERIPVVFYAKPEYDWFQMEQIRKGLKAGVDIKVYASAQRPYYKMREIRKGLEEGINLQGYLKWSAGIIREFRKARVSGVNIAKYITEGYDAEQLGEIRTALEKGINPDQFITKEYRAASIEQICKGLESKIDVSLYANIHYSWRQMREIRKGLENRVAVDKYCNRLYSWEQMREIRKGLEQGLDVDSYCLLRYTASEMRKKKQALMGNAFPMQEAVLERQVESEDFMFEVLTNDMEAYVTVLSAGLAISRERFLEILEQNGICKGIQEDAVAAIVNGRYENRAILIAKGQAPVQGEDGWYEFFFRSNVERKPKVLEDGSVDYQSIDWFEMVQEGQKLAFYHAATDGTDGYDVRGNMIKARRGAEQKVLKGTGFKLAEDRKTYTAVMDGMITLEDNEMRIANHMVLDEVNMATGNVIFNGSVHILGDVGCGTVIKAADDVVIDGHVEAVTIECGGSVVLKKGMNAAGGGMINAEKDVVSRFFEAVKVVAKGNIEVDKCLNSQLYAGGMITSSRIIAGGVSQAEKGYRINNSGNHAGIRTVLRLRIDEKVWEENLKIKAAIRDAKHELQMLNNAYEDFKAKFPPEARSNMDMFKKLENAVFSKGKQLRQLKELEAEVEQRVKKMREAKIVITGCANEGTIVEIDGCRWLAEDQHNITIKKQSDDMEVLNN